MAVKTVDNLFTFVKGKVTDSNDLSSIRGGLRASDNIDVLRDGSARRRRGLDFEPSYLLSTETLTQTQVEFDAISYGTWNDVAGNGDLNFIVLQFGLFLHVYSIDTNIVSSKFVGKLDISSFVVPGKTIEAQNYPMEFVSGKGFLFIASAYIEPLVLSYDPLAVSIRIKSIPIIIRDFIGVDDGLANDATPSTLSVEHEYNLMNQGWIATVGSGVGVGGSAFSSETIDITVLLP